MGAPVGASLLAILDQRVAELALGCVLLAVAIMQCASSGSSHEGRTRSLQADDDGKQIRSGDLEQPLLLPPSSEEAAEPTPGSHAAGTLAVLLRGQGRERGSLAGCLSLDCLSALDCAQPDQQQDSLLAGKPGRAYTATVHEDGWMKHDYLGDATESSNGSYLLVDAVPAPAPAPTDDASPAKPMRSFGKTVTRFLMGSVAGTLSGVMAGLTVRPRGSAKVPFPLVVFVQQLFPCFLSIKSQPSRCASAGILMQCVTSQVTRPPLLPPQGIDGPPVILMFHLLHVPKDVARGSNAVINLLLMPWLLISFAFMGVLHRRDVPLFAVAAAVSLMQAYQRGGYIVCDDSLECPRPPSTAVASVAKSCPALSW